MGFIEPLALAALPLALVPLLFGWWGRRRGSPLPFSSIHLFDEARRRPRPRRTRPTRRVLIARILAIALLVLAAARPVGPGRGGPGEHRPTAVVVAVDVSASVGQRAAGARAWDAIRSWGDSILAFATPDDRLALAAVSDGISGWWTGPPEVLRERLAGLEPGSRASDWPAALASLEARMEDGTEAYLLTDGAVGARPPEPLAEAGGTPGRRRLRVWETAPGVNRSLSTARWTGSDRVALGAEGWGAEASAVAGRLQGSALVDSAPIPLDGRPGAAGWTVGDSATFALAGRDRLPADDRLYVARERTGGYRVTRLAVPGEAPESGTLFWEAALASSSRRPEIARVRTVAELAARPPQLALLPIRAYRPDEAATLAVLVAAGTRLLLVPACPDPACAPSRDWLPGLDLPEVVWDLDDGDRRTALAGTPGAEGATGVPEHLLQAAPVRGALQARGGAAPDWTWDLGTGEAALRVRGRVALWLVPLGPPVTRLAATPLFPLVADAALAAWDPAWRATGSLRVGEPAPVPAGGAVVTGPLHRPDPKTWSLADGAPAPRLEQPGLYRLQADGATFLAVNGDPAEGNLAAVPGELWEAAWGIRPTPDAEWESELFAARRGPELWPWAIVLALAALIAEARLRRAGLNN